MPHSRQNLPNFLRNSYKQYKEDTNRFIGWLADAGSKWGYPVPSSRPIACSELLKIAQHVANHVETIPSAVASVAVRAIVLRKKVTQSFWSREKADGHAKHTHAYFLRVLEEILRLFKIIYEADQGSEDDSDCPAWLSTFEDLSAKYHQKSDIDSAPAPANETEATPDGEAEEETEMLSQAFFQVLCLFHDLQQWRSFVIETWHEYSIFKVDLMSAAIVTDQALKFARELIQETVEDLPEGFPNDGIDLQTLLLKHAATSTERPLPPSEDLGLPYNVELASCADWCFFSTGALLHSFAGILKPGTLPTYKPGYFGTHDRQADRAAMSVASKFQEDKILMLELLPEFSLAGMRGLAVPILDEVTLSMADLVQDQKSSLLHSFAARLMLDAYHATRYMKLNAFDDLRMMSLRIARTIDRYRDLASTLPRPSFWPQEAENEITAIQEHVTRFIEKDGFLALRTTLSGPSFTVDHSANHLIFRRNPILCGVFAFQLNFRMQTVGHLLVSKWLGVQQLAFLWNISKNTTGIDQLDWPDMALYVFINSEEQVFQGRPPGTIEESFERLQEVIGKPDVPGATKIPSRRENQGRKGKESHGDWLEPRTKTASLFGQYYSLEIENPELRHSIGGNKLNEFLDKVLVQPKERKGKSGKGKGKGKGKEQCQGRGTASPRDLLTQKWHQKHSLAFIQLLVLIKSKLHEDEPYFLFDYFGMHWRSIEILRLIREREHLKFVQYFSDGYLPDDALIANLVFLVLHVAVGSTKAAKQLGLAGGKQVTSRIIVSCADVMRRYLSGNGDVAVKDLRVFCKNKTSLALAMKSSVKRDSAGQQREAYWFCLGETLHSAQLIPSARESEHGIPEK